LWLGFQGLELAFTIDDVAISKPSVRFSYRTSAAFKAASMASFMVAITSSVPSSMATISASEPSSMVTGVTLGPSIALGIPYVGMLATKATCSIRVAFVAFEVVIRRIGLIVLAFVAKFDAALE
jgi:hypothetical protein